MSITVKSIVVLIFDLCINHFRIKIYKRINVLIFPNWSQVYELRLL